MFRDMDLTNNPLKKKEDTKEEPKGVSNVFKDLAPDLASEYVADPEQPINLKSLGQAGVGLLANKGVTYLSEKAHIDKGISENIGTSFGGGITSILTKYSSLDALEAGSALAAPETLGASFAAGSLLAGAIELGSHLFSSGML